jgi:type II secretion system protein G
MTIKTNKRTLQKLGHLGGQAGFTLVELLVVIAIMSILTIIAVSQFQSAKRKSRDVQRKGDISAVSKALLMYYTDYGYFPESEEGKIKDAGWGTTFTDNGYDYLKEMPRENYSEIPFCYVTDGGTQPTKFGLFSILENPEDIDYNKLNDESDYIDYGPFSECGGNSYNFAILSPNANITDITDI